MTRIRADKDAPRRVQAIRRGLSEAISAVINLNHIFTPEGCQQEDAVLKIEHVSQLAHFPATPPVDIDTHPQIILEGAMFLICAMITARVWWCICLMRTVSDIAAAPLPHTQPKHPA